MYCKQCRRNDIPAWKMASNAVDTCKMHDFINRRRQLYQEEREYDQLEKQMLEKRKKRNVPENY